MSELIQNIEALDDEQVCKVTLWMIDELKEAAEKEGSFEGKLEVSSEEYLRDFIDALGEEDIRKLSEEWMTDENIVTVAKNFLLMLASDKTYSEKLKEAIQAVGRTRAIGDIIALVSALKEEMGIVLIIFLALRFRIRFKVVTDEDGKLRSEFKFEIGKKGILIDFLKNLLKNN